MKDKKKTKIQDGEINFTLCCGGRRCPTVKITPNFCSITDDYESTVIMTNDQLKELAKRVKDIDF